MSVTTQESGYRIGQVARLVGVTTRTIRYYEELGLLGTDAERPKGGHRVYGESDVKRLQELIRLRDLLGLSLEELVELVEAEQARDALRSRWETHPDDHERLQIINAATPLVERQLELVSERREALDLFADDLEEKLELMRDAREQLERVLAASASRSRSKTESLGANGSPARSG
jgi:MerR family transcriptional regulator, repressor of the yfmOP operon